MANRHQKRVSHLLNPLFLWALVCALSYGSSAMGRQADYDILFCHDSKENELFRAMRYESCKDGTKEISRSQWIDLAREKQQISEEEFRYYKNIKPIEMDSRLTATSNGTAFAIHPSGVWATSYHVISACKKVVLFTEVDLFPAKIVAVSKEHDLAVLSSVSIPTRIAKIRRTPTSLGERIYAFGFPYVMTLRTLNMSDGIVSGVRVLGVIGLMQLTTPLQPGNSGGPLLDETGLVSGVVAARMSEGQSVGFGVQGNVLIKFLNSENIEHEVGEATEVLTSQAIAIIATKFTRPVLCLNDN